MTVLIVGLGNPGAKYEHTRHNAGFIAVDHLASHYQFSFQHKSKFNADIAEGSIQKFGKLILAKPSTYMNLSGVAIKSICSYYNVKPESVYVIHDDIDLGMGQVKYKLGGGNGGHNGLKSLDQNLGNNYHRIRIGIGRPSFGTTDVADYVLRRFLNDEYQLVIASTKKITDNINLLLSEQLEEFKRNIG